MRVLLDVSWLGLGHLYSGSRTGSFRVHQHLARELAGRGDVELLLCANCSGLAFQGAAAYLRSDPALSHVPLLAPGKGTETGTALGTAVRRVHRAARALVPADAFPAWLRAAARGVDRRAHPPVTDATPPADVFHSPATPLPRRARAAPGPVRLLTVYDVVHPGNAHLHAPSRVQASREALRSLHPDDWVITTSHATRADLCEFAGTDPARVLVTPLAADPQTFHPVRDAGADARVRARLGLPEGPYLLALNVMDARKNMVGLVRAFARLVRQERQPVSLVVAGPAGAGSPQLDAALAEARASGARVATPAFVPDDDLAALYGGALAFVYPSLHEGFGLPPLEAMQCGTPVITSRASSLPEVAGDAALLVEPGDEDALCQAMLDVVRDAGLRERLSARSLARAAQFSWARCADDTVAAYRTALAARAGTPASGRGRRARVDLAW